MGSSFICTLCRESASFCCEVLVELHIALEHASVIEDIIAAYIKEMAPTTSSEGRSFVPFVYLELSKILASYAYSIVKDGDSSGQSRDIQQYLNGALEALQADSIDMDRQATLAAAIRMDEEILLNWIKPTMYETFAEPYLLTLSSQPSNAQNLLNLVDRFLVRERAQGNVESRPNWQERQLLRRISIKLADRAGDLPQALKLTGVELQHSTPIRGGSFADIFLGTFHGRKVAMKRLRCFLEQGIDDHIKLGKKFCREALMWKNLRHLNVLPFLGIVTPGPKLLDGLQETYLVSPWMNNGHVRAYVNGLASESKEAEVLRLPNILIDDKHHARLADFGLSRLDGSTSATNGSLEDISSAWRAPELNQAAEDDLTEACAPTVYSDLYSYGCVCWELSTNTNPKRYDIAKAESGAWPVRPSSFTSDGLWDVIVNCSNIHPEARETAYELTVKLRKLEMNARQTSGQYAYGPLTPIGPDSAPNSAVTARESVNWMEDDHDTSVSIIRRGFSQSPDTAAWRLQPMDESPYDETTTRKRVRNVDDGSPTRKKPRKDNLPSNQSSSIGTPHKTGKMMGQDVKNAKRSPGKRFVDYTRKLLGKVKTRTSKVSSLSASPTATLVEDSTQAAGRSVSIMRDEVNAGLRETSRVDKRKRADDQESPETKPLHDSKKRKTLLPWTRGRRS
ncbi:hypothetical protein EIP86_001082 [Pleurotus ostreatoroseus]|nr:hypothetical protein EIP86_001082 [Pleurotus ostreatoroseus]